MIVSSGIQIMEPGFEQFVESEVSIDVLVESGSWDSYLQGEPMVLRKDDRAAGQASSQLVPQLEEFMVPLAVGTLRTVVAAPLDFKSMKVESTVVQKSPTTWTVTLESIEVALGALEFQTEIRVPEHRPDDM